MKPHALVFAVGTLWSVSAGATVLWRGDFETGNFKQWGVPSNNPERRTLVMDPVREGKYAGRIEIHMGDLGASMLNRVEISTTQPASTKQENADVYYAWSVMISADNPFVKGSHQIAYFEAYKVYHQLMSFNVSADDFTFITNLPRYTTQWKGKIPAGRWHDFVLHVKWSMDPTVGFVELWYDGVQVVPKRMIQSMYKDPDNGTALWSFFDHGIIRDKTLTAVEVLFHDGAMAATEFADVMARYRFTDGGVVVTDAAASGPGDAPPPRDGATARLDGPAAADGGASVGAGGGAGGAEPDPGGGGGAPGDVDHPLNLDQAPSGCHCALGSAGGSRAPAALALLALLALGRRQRARRTTPPRR